MEHKNTANVLFILTDDQRFDTIAALGNTRIKTPNLDRLVASGTCFTQAHIPGGTSAAVCMPSRAMIHTGRSLFHIKGNGVDLDPSHTTLGESFGRRGYRTFGTGKWHNGPVAFNRSFASGEDIYFGGMADHWNVPAYHYDPSGAYATRLPRCNEPMLNNKVNYIPCDHISNGVHSTELVGRATRDFIAAQSTESPFFAYAAFLAPHDPRTMPERFRAMYDAADIELPPNFCGGHPFDNGELHIRDEELAPFPRDPEGTRKHLAEYYGMISHLDHEIGTILDALETKGLREKTIVVLAGDNGLALGQHGLMGKQSLYDHSVRIPLIFSGPGVPAGLKVDSPCYLFDIFPTLCSLTGGEIPGSVEGVDLTALMKEPRKPLREDLYLAYCSVQRGIQRGNYKLIEYVVGGKHTRTQLFNTKTDPWEMTDLAQKETTLVAELQALLRRRASEWGDRDTEWGAKFWAGMDA